LRVRLGLGLVVFLHAGKRLLARPLWLRLFTFKRFIIPLHCNDATGAHHGEDQIETETETGHDGSRAASRLSATPQARPLSVRRAGGYRRYPASWITTAAFLALARQARHQGVTKRAMLERVIGDGQKKTLATIRGTPAQAAYWKVFRRKARVTQ
jgi:hypothetical protein